ncbi:MAG: Peptide methionine sulfoxide reductase MsrA [Ignavibacteriae bacterium]|nr:MAG: Peptide methionine sulfoxide reductase MsrA [Ignavibacteriota bacterium]
MENKSNIKYEKATFAGGCFWCTEAVFEEVEGVVDVVSGYSGGFTDNPTYEEVCTGRTGHAECVQITYNPDKITYEKLLDIFWMVHDPTTLNRQGADVGTQYRSAIFYHSEEQRLTAEKSKLNISKYFKDKIVTEIAPLKKFFKAEEYHQDYFKKNPDAAYCKIVIKPKLEKLRIKLEGKTDEEKPKY